MKTNLMNVKAGGGKLPQCKVCNDESSGFHYGVDSCEGCKGFFRRCITQGMTHRCANEEKCEITPFTRNSCQYCRLKKCFEVGMSREASRLGRRPKRLKEVGGESSRSHSVNLPIAPYPSPQELYRLRMAELQKLLQTNGTFKSELMQAFLSAAQQSFREHSKSGTNNSSSTTTMGATTSTPSMSSSTASPTSLAGATASAADVGSHMMNPSFPMGGSTDAMPNVDSPSMHAPSPFPDLDLSVLSPLPSGMDLNTAQGGLGAFDNFLMSPGSGNMNGTSVYSPGQSSDVNNPLVMPPLDMGLPSQTGMNEAASTSVPNSTSFLLDGNSAAGFLSNNGNMNSANLNNNTHMLQEQMSPTSTMLSPGSIKIEPNTKTEYTELASKLAEIREDQAVIDRILMEVKETPLETRRLLIEQVTDAIVEAHMATTINTYSNVEEANARIARMMKNKDDSTMPDLSRLSLDPNTMWRQFVSSMLPEITKVVKFCKKLPGFSDLEQEDQIKLIKQGTFEVMMCRYSPLVDVEKEEMFDPTLTVKSNRSVIREMPLGSFLDEFFFVANQINPLHLTDGEIGLYTSILMICPDRSGLDNIRAITKIRQLYQQSLYLLMKHNHSDPDYKFSRLMGLIPVFKRINADHAQQLNSVKMKMPDEFERFPPLHKEMFNSGH